MHELIERALAWLCENWPGSRQTVQKLLKIAVFARVASDLALMGHGLAHVWAAVIHMHLPDDSMWRIALTSLAEHAAPGEVVDERGFYLVMIPIGVSIAGGGLWRLRQRWCARVRHQANLTPAA